MSTIETANNEAENVENAFQAPQADLTEVTGNRPIMEFERFSAWWVFLLGVVTLGIYNLYWLYDRANKINSLTQGRKASTTMISIYIVFYALSFGFEMFFNNGDETMSMVSLIISLGIWVFYIISVFSVRGALQSLINEGEKQPVSVGGILTFFFSTIYFQYKINEAIDYQNQGEE